MHGKILKSRACEVMYRSFGKHIVVSPIPIYILYTGIRLTIILLSFQEQN